MKQIYIFKPLKEYGDIFTKDIEINLQLKIIITRYKGFKPKIQKYSNKKINSILQSLKMNEYYELIGGKEC